LSSTKHKGKDRTPNKQRNSLAKKPTPSTIRFKLTGDGTQIGRGLKVVNIIFTVNDEGERANSVVGITLLQF